MNLCTAKELILEHLNTHCQNRLLVGAEEWSSDDLDLGAEAANRGWCWAAMTNLTELCPSCEETLRLTRTPNCQQVLDIVSWRLNALLEKIKELETTQSRRVKGLETQLSELTKRVSEHH